MKVSDYIAQSLHARGVTVVFEVIGGMITHLIDSFHLHGGIRIVSVHHEQAASFAADAAGRMTGVPGVALATSGPGATNLITGIGSCYFDSTPAVFITGQVNRNEQKRDRPIRQLGFQETDIVAMVGAVTKGAWRVEAPEDVPRLLDEAFALALSGRPGPVLLDIPLDVQRCEIDVPAAPAAPAAPQAPVLDEAGWDEIVASLHAAERPLILAGGGLHAARALAPFRRFVDAAGIPVVSSLMAVDALPHDHPLRVGFLGSYGNRWTNLAIGESDLLLVLGSRLDIRQTGADAEAFRQGRHVIHVDCDAGEMNNRVSGCTTVPSHLAPFLDGLLAALARHPAAGAYEAWRARIAALKAQWPDTGELNDVPGINPNAFMHALSRASRDASAYVVDVGQHQMWAAQSLDLEASQRFLTSGGMGAMGFALPGALGVALVDERPVVMIAGDGGFQLNLQEMQTIVRNRLPVKMVILNNHCHGMVRQFQESYFHQRYQSTYWGYSAPDFSRLAEAYGIRAAAVSDPEAVDGALRALWADPSEPFLLEVMIDTFANAYPKIAFGHPMTEMEPYATPLEMEGT